MITLKGRDATTFDFAAGELLGVDKPLHWTSYDVVRKLKFATGVKTGHAGTLDPLASGLLLVAAGKYTKKIAELQGLDKTYTGTMVLGAVTASFDLETEVEVTSKELSFTVDFLQEAAHTFTGEILQKPPAYSAVKVMGERLYKKARKGESVVRPPRQIRVDRFEITAYDSPVVTFEVDCGSGTYIRSLVHDLGQKLGTGAYLSSLVRTGIGPYKLSDAWALDALVEAIRKFRGDEQ